MHRSVMAFKECTRDPIFLLQTRKLIYHTDKMDDELNCDVDDDYRYTDKETGKAVDDDEMIERELAASYWETESVWYSREEAEAYGRRRHYHYGKEDRDWKVYCVCCEGELQTILNKHSDSRDMSVSSPEIDRWKERNNVRA